MTRARPLVDVQRGGESWGEGEGQEAHGEGSRQEEAGGVCLPSLPPSVSQITHPLLFSSPLHPWSGARRVDATGQLCGGVEGKDHDLASCPLLSSILTSCQGRK